MLQKSSNYILRSRFNFVSQRYLLVRFWAKLKNVTVSYKYIVPYIVLSLHEEPASFYGEKQSVIFVTGHLFTFLVVLINIQYKYSVLTSRTQS